MKVLIVSGGEPPSEKLFGRVMRDFVPETIIAVDSGANALFKYKMVPDFVLGDFDSIDQTALVHYQNHSEVIRSPIEKDETDTELAIHKAVELNASEIIILGATGLRLDHTLGNIFLLKKVQGYDIACVLIDDKQEISLMKDKKEFFSMQGKTVSLITLTEKTTDILTEGFYYPLNGEILECGETRGISNIINDEYASVQIGSGELLVIVNQSVE